MRDTHYVLRNAFCNDLGTLMEYSPWKTFFGDMIDEEWEAIWLFLGSLPPREYGNR